MVNMYKIYVIMKGFDMSKTSFWSDCKFLTCDMMVMPDSDGAFSLFSIIIESLTHKKYVGSIDAPFHESFTSLVAHGASAYLRFL